MGDAAALDAAALDEGSRALLQAHWPQLSTPFSAEKFAAGGGLSAPLLERAREHFGLLDRTVKLRLLLGCGCLRAAEATALAEHVTGLVHAGQADDDSWVRALAAVIGAQRGVEDDEDALDEGVPEEAALIERLAARAAEPSMLQPEEAAFMSGSSGSAALPTAKAHFTIGGAEAVRAAQRKAAADACRLPKVAWEEANPTKSASAPGGASKPAGKRGRDSSEDAKTEARQRAKEEYLAKRRAILLTFLPTFPQFGAHFLRTWADHRSQGGGVGVADVRGRPRRRERGHDDAERRHGVQRDGAGQSPR